MQITTLVYRLLELAKILESCIYVHGIRLFMLYTAILPFIKCVIMLLVVDYSCAVEKSFELMPNRKRPMMSLGVHNYTAAAAANGFTNSKCLSDYILSTSKTRVK